jgi:hypothetical protein
LNYYVTMPCADRGPDAVISTDKQKSCCKATEGLSLPLIFMERRVL